MEAGGTTACVGNEITTNILTEGNRVVVRMRVVWALYNSGGKNSGGIGTN